MTSPLYFPRYTPDEFHIRAYIILYEKIGLMIPPQDVGYVFNDSPTLSHLNDNGAFDIYDPTWEGFYWHQKTEEVVDKIIERCISSSPYRLFNRKAVSLGYSKTKNKIDFHDRVHFDDTGWYTIATQKIPYYIIETAIDRSLAFEIRNHPRETSALIMHPALAGFIMGQVTSEIAERNRLVAITDHRLNAAFALHNDREDNYLSPSQVRGTLLSLIIRFAIPENIVNIPCGDFWEIRERLSGVRRRLNTDLQELVLEHDIDSANGFQELNERLLDAQNEIQKDISVEIGRHKKEKRRTFFVETFARCAGGLLGTLAGGHPGGILGSAVVPGIQRLTSRYTKPLNIDGGNALQRFGLLHATLQQRAHSYSYKRHNYKI